MFNAPKPPIGFEPRMVGSGYKNRVAGKPPRAPRKKYGKDGSVTFDPRDVVTFTYINKNGETIIAQQDVTGRYGDMNYSDYALKRAKKFKGTGAGKFQRSRKMDRRNIMHKIGKRATADLAMRAELVNRFLTVFWKNRLVSLFNQYPDESFESLWGRAVLLPEFIAAQDELKVAAAVMYQRARDVLFPMIGRRKIKRKALDVVG